MAQNETLSIIARMVDRVSRPAARMGRTVARAFKRPLSAVAGLTKKVFSLRGLLVGVLALFGAGQVGSHVNQVAQATAEYGKWARKLRTTADELHRLDFAAVMSGARPGDIAEGLKTVQERLDDASRGSVTYQEHLRMLGISATDAEGRVRNAVEILPEMAQALKALRASDPGRLTLFAEDFLGGSEHFLSLLLEQGPEAIRLYGQALDKLGATVTPEQAQRAREYVQLWRTLKEVTGSIKRGIVDKLLPTDFINALVNFLAENKDRVIDFFVAAIRRAVDAIEWLIDKISALIDVLQTPFEGIASMFEWARARIFDSGKDPNILGFEKRLDWYREKLTLALKAKREFDAGISTDERTANVGGSIDYLIQKIHEVGEEYVQAGGSARAAQAAIDSANLSAGFGFSSLLNDHRGFVEKYKNRNVNLDLITNPPNNGRIMVFGSAAKSRIGSQGQALDEFFGNFGEQIDRAIERWTSWGQAGIDAANSVVDSLGNNISDALADGILKVRTFKDAFKEMGKAVVADIARIGSRLVTSGLFSFIGGSLGFTTGNFFAAAKGAVFPGGLRRLARGGITRGPELALIGDNPGGEEAVLPLERRHGKLGVRASRGRDGMMINVTVNAQMIDGANSERWLAQHGEMIGQQVAVQVARVAALKTAIRRAR